MRSLEPRFEWQSAKGLRNATVAANQDPLVDEPSPYENFLGPCLEKGVG